jgi:acetylornithine deacetylase/succinyl-diaminopimelate desuccinylase-like protein
MRLGTLRKPCPSSGNRTYSTGIVSKDRSYHSMLRTTCVATLLEGGHANNALPQRAAANVNCRIFPGETVEETQAALVAAIGDPGVKVTLVPPVKLVAVPPPLDPKIIGPAEKLVAPQSRCQRA